MSYPHFKWLNSSFKWLNICQASETWVSVITRCSPLMLAIFPLLLFAFSQAMMTRTSPVYIMQPQHKSSIMQEKNKNKKITLDPGHAHRAPCPAFSCHLSCICHRLHVYLHWGFKKQEDKLSQTTVGPDKYYRGMGERELLLKLKCRSQQPVHDRKKKIRFLQTSSWLYAGAYLCARTPLKAPLSCHTSLESPGWQLQHNLHGQPAPSPISTIRKLS